MVAAAASALNAANAPSPHADACCAAPGPGQVGTAACAYAGEALAMLEATLADSFHEINVEACGCVKALAGAPSLASQ